MYVRRMRTMLLYEKKRNIEAEKNGGIFLYNESFQPLSNA